jgi:hypothetical protein
VRHDALTRRRDEFLGVQEDIDLVRLERDEVGDPSVGGNMAKALLSRVDEMLAIPPSVEPVDILCMKNQLA